MMIKPSILDKARRFLVDEGTVALYQMIVATEFIWQQRPAGPDPLVNNGDMINALRRLVSNFGLASTILLMTVRAAQRKAPKCSLCAKIA